MSIPSPASAIARPSPTILLAEDEDAVRRLLAELLRKAGYRVLAAASGALALAAAAAHLEPIDLLITDVSMPAMTGPELARQLTALHVKVQVLFISGYSELGALADLPGQPDFQYLHKPFTPRTLLERVRALLE